jgi:hypothetical protein
MKTRLALASTFALLFLFPHGCPASTIWCEAELFRDLGGWTNDSQFVDQMGSPFLLAIGLDGPVHDAVTEVRIPAAGNYRLWVRCHDWLPQYSPGRFQVVLGGAAVEHVFGQNKAKGWIWEDGGARHLAAGSLQVRLHDLTGHYGRCDAIVLSDDSAWQPPSDREKLLAARKTLGPLAREVHRLPRFDTVVVGGGLAGTFAAVASARMGCRTALVQDRPVLGGNSSSEILVNPEGDTTREPLDPGEGGIIEEVRGPVQGYSERMGRLVRRQSNLEVYFNTHVIGVEKSNPETIDAVVAVDANSNRQLIVPGKTFIDCTGDGSIGVWAGAEHRHGREPRAMYGESRAPEKPDGHTMGGTLRYASQKQLQPVAFTAPDWARKFPHCSDFHVDRHPKIDFGGWQWVIEYGGMLNTYDDAEAIRDELLRIIWGMWDHVKNHCPKLKDQAEKYKLAWVSYVVGKRESRRLIGDYVLVEQDIAARRLFADRVSYAGWGIDIHPPGGFYDTEPPAIFSHKVKFSIPFRCLYSKNVDNLLMAGRCISVSHVALGATRVMITCGLQGQAVGTAAGMCKIHETTPRIVGQNYIADLQQQLLKDGCYLIDLPNEDQRDLARTAKATASSTAPPIVIPLAAHGNVHPLGTDRAVMFRAPAAVKQIALYLTSARDTATPLRLTLRAAAELGRFDATQDVATAVATVPRHSSGWVTFDLNAAAPIKPGLYYVSLPATRALSWTLFETTPPHTMRAYRSGTEWAAMDGCYAFLLNPTAESLRRPPAASPPPPPEPTPKPGPMFAAENVIDGYARAIRGVPHSWRPDPRQPYPQWVQLDFGQSVGFNTIHVSFQSKEMRAEDFRFEVSDGGPWQSVAEISGNLDRRGVLRIKPVRASQLRLVIAKARRDMGVCEIRVYDDP